LVSLCALATVAGSLTIKPSSHEEGRCSIIAPSLRLHSSSIIVTMNGTTTPPITVKPLPTIPAYGDNAIEVQNLTFAYRSDPSGSSLHNPDHAANSLVLQDMNLCLATGSRCLLIGANGSGKSVSFFYLIMSLISAATRYTYTSDSHCLNIPFFSFYSQKRHCFESSRVVT